MHFDYKAEIVNFSRGSGRAYNSHASPIQPTNTKRNIAGNTFHDCPTTRAAACLFHQRVGSTRATDNRYTVCGSLQAEADGWCFLRQSVGAQGVLAGVLFCLVQHTTPAISVSICPHLVPADTKLIYWPSIFSRRC